MRVTLNLGIEYLGHLYRDCVVRLLTIGGECCAQEGIAELGIPDENRTPRQERLVDLAYLSQQVEVVGLPAGVDATFLFEHLTDEDYWLLIEATLQLRKKRLGVGESQEQASQNPTAETA